jgi:tRNA G18 (ribose-2'-O)-methylase SpoU
MCSGSRNAGPMATMDDTQGGYRVVSTPNDESIVGVGPWVGPVPDDSRLDPLLLAEGDRRNVDDRFRYWRSEAIVAELATTRVRLEVAIENLGHDFNIGSVVRTANAFNVRAVHVVGRRRWNRRGAMVTDRYLDVRHHPTPADLVAHADGGGLTLVGIDNLPGSVPLETFALPRDCLLVFGTEGPGLSEPMIEACSAVLAISQTGSTRSVNVGAAAAIAMHAWVRAHVFGQHVSASPGS